MDGYVKAVASVSCQFMYTSEFRQDASRSPVGAQKALCCMA